MTSTCPKGPAHSSLGPRSVGSEASGKQRHGSTPDIASRKGKSGKARWFSQLKDWVSVSEPSSQALKHYKEDTYRRAGVAMDDPRANAKLHLPVGTLPPEAIKPAGPGPDPEEIAIRKAEQRRKVRESFGGSTSVSRGSRSSASHYSSSSSVALGGS
ncbi:hypothetical protein F4780DRAFT_206853 [Xylariomycetidae sp. FL0641]|nr:hypothetical protein F4780DRAFT_206853 [Xylariomycetidae sp. FL0641]